MDIEFLSLLAVTIAAFVCPILSALIPNKLIPETVFLLVAGMVLGPHVFAVVVIDPALSLLSDLGLAFLFLLAGYEIDPKKLSSAEGKHGFATWAISFAIAIVIALLIPGFSDDATRRLAIAIALTTTAFGTIVPILHERNLADTRIGNAVTAYGTWGELGPVIAIALLLSSRAMWLTFVILLAFSVLAILSAFIPKRLKEKGAPINAFITKNSETNSQMTVRGVVLLLIALVTLSAVFKLDIVLGSFAAGFALRSIIPKGDSSLEKKLQGIAYGFFIPLFFAVSGAQIDATVVLANPLILIVFIIMLILIRTVPIYIALSVFAESKDMEPRTKATISLYCTTALPLIVAVTSIATSSGVMSDDVASVLIAAGGITVLVMPMLASIMLHTIDAKMGAAIKSIVNKPSHTFQILGEHHRLEQEQRADHTYVLTKDTKHHQK